MKDKSNFDIRNFGLKRIPLKKIRKYKTANLAFHFSKNYEPLMLGNCQMVAEEDIQLVFYFRQKKDRDRYEKLQASMSEAQFQGAMFFLQALGGTAFQAINVTDFFTALQVAGDHTHAFFGIDTQETA